MGMCEREEMERGRLSEGGKGVRGRSEGRE